MTFATPLPLAREANVKSKAPLVTYVGAVDGFLGLKTRQAVKAMQLKYNLPADSYPTAELLTRMRAAY